MFKYRYPDLVENYANNYFIRIRFGMVYTQLT
jgi:hypothetical protein